MATGLVGLTWIWIMLAGGVSAMPLGGAPLPLDPALSAVAPQECLWYGSSSGQTDANPDSENETEQLFAEPQVQRLAEEIETQIMSALGMATQRGGREEQVLARSVPPLIKGVMLRPFVFYIEDVEVTDKGPGGQGVDGSAAFVINAGEQKEEIEKAINNLLQLEPKAFREEQLEGVAWKRAFLGRDISTPVVRMGWKGDYFIVAIGEETAKTVLERMEAGNTPDWLEELRSEHPLERELAVGYFNVARVLEKVRPYVENEQGWDAANKLGLMSIEAIHTRSGYDAVACKTMMHVKTDGQRKGLLGLIPYKPLSKRDLQAIPKNPLLAVAKRVDVDEVIDVALRIASDFEPRAKEQFEQGLWQVESQTGVNLRNDIIKNLDDVWIAYLPGGDLMSSWLGSAVAVKVKDRARLSEAIDKIVALAQQQMQQQFQNGRRRGGATIQENTVGDHTIYSLQVTGEAFPFSPAWCVSDEWLVFGLMPQTVRDVLEREEEDSLADVEVVREPLAASDAPSVVFYVDTPRLVRSVYPWVQMGVQAIASQARREGLNFDTTALPSVEVIAKHLQPGVSTWTHKRDGFHFTSHHSLPGSGNMMAIAPMGVALVVPAVGSARLAAQTVTEINQLKQFALAVLNYESAHGEFPTDIYDDDGNALLSWRVKILPYMEAQNIYDRFHLDEAWDSDHNKPLLEMMPDIFKSPSGEAPAGKTRFLSFSGEGMIMNGEEAAQFRSITDGSSNTLLVVQANIDKAVEWSKPGDLKFDPQSPFDGLLTETGMFLGVFCDGHVSRISNGIDEETMKALVTKDGGEIIDHNQMNMNPQQRVMEVEDAEAVEFDVEIDMIDLVPQ
ncbi:DUF1559 family PulG-like putative transporter [Adhaeretor mobilis]|uniref:DUF1559 domain-containing protein n=1 Tax=Adhaeretor mobilis TaxID=1930276 RepID=A0A517N200_9BACT|nr:DUF1559 domain-containing protein [Adhaeretor mobilis]QDT01167.1 hypothetical protein HG15A2_45090 [Adhaeretor mobilis]